MHRRGIGVVPADCEDREAWARAEVEKMQFDETMPAHWKMPHPAGTFTPISIEFREVQTYAEDRKTKIKVTLAEAVCED